MKKNWKTKTSIYTIAATLFFAFALNYLRLDIRYSQFFADRKIVLTEKLTVIEQIKLPFKKGFVGFEL